MQQMGSVMLGCLDAIKMHAHSRLSNIKIVKKPETVQQRNAI